MENIIGGLFFVNNLQSKTIYLSRQVGQYRFDFHSNNRKISTGNDLKHAANVSGRGPDIFVTVNSY